MADDRRPPPIEVIESLTRDPDGHGADWEVADGPWEFGSDRAVAYVRQPGPFRDTLRVEVRVTASGAEREAAKRYAALPSIADEYDRMAALLGQPVTFRGEEGVLIAAAHKLNVGVEVRVTHPPATPHPADQPCTRTGWSLDVAAVE